MMKKTLCIFAAAALLMGCSGRDEGTTYGVGPIYPDYRGVTVPTTIAPLDFSYTGETEKKPVTTFSAGKVKVKFRGKNIHWATRSWRKLTEAAKGGEITVTSTAIDTVWTIKVSLDSIDYGVNYRLASPGFEAYSKMGIYERVLSSNKQRAIFDNIQFDGGVEGIAFNQCNPKDFSLNILGKHKATIVRKNHKSVTHDMDPYLCQWPYWHPGGDFIAYSTNDVRKDFYTLEDKVVEVYDNSSAIVVYSVPDNEILSAHSVMQDGILEAFPSFSPDGRTMYFCSAVKATPDQVRYNLCKVSFYPETGAIGDDIQILVNAEKIKKSVSYARPSYDGKFIVYTLSDFGYEAMWHHESDLWIYEIATGKTWALDAANSADADGYCSWSSNSRWIAFESRRDDGLFTRTYICHIDENGNCGKAFMLPQERPYLFYEKQMYSYDYPEFVKKPMRMNKLHVQKLVNSPERVSVDFRWAE